MSDKLNWICLLGLGYCLVGNRKPCCHATKGANRGEKTNPYKVYISDIYPISFQYPSNWVQNKNYQNRYEGEDGFFEVAEIKALGRNIDEVAQQEVDTPIKPYGNNPKIQLLTIGGEPARLILPSEDQSKIFDREVALIIKDKIPVEEKGELYNYTIIWSDCNTMKRIIDTAKFVD